MEQFGSQFKFTLQGSKPTYTSRQTIFPKLPNPEDFQEDLQTPGVGLIPPPPDSQNQSRPFRTPTLERIVTLEQEELVGSPFKIDNKKEVVNVVYDKESGIKVARYRGCRYNPKKQIYTQVGKKKPAYTRSLQEVEEMIRLESNPS